MSHLYIGPSHRRLLALVVLLGFTRCAWSQSGGPPWLRELERPWKTTISNDVLELLRQSLNLSEGQQIAMQHARREHIKRFSAMVAEGKSVETELDQQIKDQTNPLDLIGLSEARITREKQLAKFADRQITLDNQFFDDVRTFLADAQLQQWDTTMRAHRRARWRNTGSILEGRFNLFGVIDRVDVDLGCDIASVELVGPLLDQYGIEFDRALTRRYEVLRKHARRHEQNRRRVYDRQRNHVRYLEPPNTASERRKLREQFDVVCDIRAVNVKFLGLLLPLLPQSISETVEWEYWSRAMQPLNEHLNRWPGHRALREASAMPTLDDDQGNALEDLSRSYGDRFRSLFRTLMDSAQEQRSFYYRLGSDAVEWGDQREVRQAFNVARYRMLELDDRIVREVWHVLTEQQREMVGPCDPTPDQNEVQVRELRQRKIDQLRSRAGQ